MPLLAPSTQVARPRPTIHAARAMMLAAIVLLPFALTQAACSDAEPGLPDGGPPADTGRIPDLGGPDEGADADAGRVPDLGGADEGSKVDMAVPPDGPDPLERTSQAPLVERGAYGANNKRPGLAK